jgi:Domain of unknown function (DUF5666)
MLSRLPDDLFRKWSCTLCFLVSFLCLVLTACGPGEEGTGARAQSVNVGVVTEVDDSHVTVNGVQYERSRATMVDGFNQSLNAQDLRLGMWVEVHGSVEDDVTQGVAQTIRVRPAARGLVSKRDATTLEITVLDNRVTLDGATVTAGLAPDATFSVGDSVEVHGALGGVTENVSASRVEKLVPTQDSAPPFELRGRIRALNNQARTFSINNRTISYATASVRLEQPPANGMVVRVASTAAPVTGQRWSVDQVVADQPLPLNLPFLYIEGFVDALEAGPRFQIEGVSVNASAAINRGSVNTEGVRIATFGPLVNGVLAAKTITLIESGQSPDFLMTGSVERYISAESFYLRGIEIDASKAVFFPRSANLANGVAVRVRGKLLGRKLMARTVAF